MLEGRQGLGVEVAGGLTFQVPDHLDVFRQQEGVLAAMRGQFRIIDGAHQRLFVLEMLPGLVGEDLQGGDERPVTVRRLPFVARGLANPAPVPILTGQAGEGRDEALGESIQALHQGTVFLVDGIDVEIPVILPTDREHGLGLS